MTQKLNLHIAVLTFVGCFVLLAMRPVPATAIFNVKSITGKIIKVSEDANLGTVMIKLRNDDRNYHINQGAKNGMDLQILKNNLLYRQATLDLVKPRTTEEPENKIVAVSRVMVSGQILLQQPMAKFVSY